MNLFVQIHEQEYTWKVPMIISIESSGARKIIK